MFRCLILFLLFFIFCLHVYCVWYYFLFFNLIYRVCLFAVILYHFWNCAQAHTLLFYLPFGKKNEKIFIFCSFLRKTHLSFLYFSPLLNSDIMKWLFPLNWHCHRKTIDSLHINRALKNKRQSLYVTSM